MEGYTIQSGKIILNNLFVLALLYAGLGTMLIGLAGLIFLLWLYNRQYKKNNMRKRRGCRGAAAYFWG